MPRVDFSYEDTHKLATCYCNSRPSRPRIWKICIHSVAKGLKSIDNFVLVILLARHDGGGRRWMLLREKEKGMDFVGNAILVYDIFSCLFVVQTKK